MGRAGENEGIGCTKGREAQPRGGSCGQVNQKNCFVVLRVENRFPFAFTVAPRGGAHGLKKRKTALGKSLSGFLCFYIFSPLVKTFLLNYCQYFEKSVSLKSHPFIFWHQNSINRLFNRVISIFICARSG